MTEFLIDTNAYSAYRRGDADAVQIVSQASRLAISTVVLGELLAGFAGGGRQAQNVIDLRAFLTSPRASVLVVDQTTSEQYAVIFAALRAAGVPIPTNDMWIAASAIQHGLPVFTLDAHFTRVGGVRIIRTPADLVGP